MKDIMDTKKRNNIKKTKLPVSRELSTPPINQRIEQLNQKVEWFYSDDFSLDMATSNYQEVVNMTKAIEDDLKHLQNQIEIIDQDFSKEPK